MLTIEAVQLEADGTIKFKVSSVNKIKRVRTGVGDGGGVMGVAAAKSARTRFALGASLPVHPPTQLSVRLPRRAWPSLTTNAPSPAPQAHALTFTTTTGVRALDQH